MSARRRLSSIFALAFAGLGALALPSCGSSGNGDSGVDASLSVDSSGPSFVVDSGDEPASNCTPLTCAAQGYDCGFASDGCGGVLQCGTTCPAGLECGVGGFDKCGDPALLDDGGVAPPCTPKTCADLGYDCGKAIDGCNNVIDCGPTACPSGGVCGGGGFNKCGGPDGGLVPDAGPPCTPKTCASAGFNCGQAGDGCGGTIGPCGTCTSPQVCGATKPNVCGSNVPCTGLCLQQPACTGGKTTTLHGTVRAGLQEGTTSWVPAGTKPDPVPGVLVYIPQTAVDPFDVDPTKPQVSCKTCGADVSGNPLVTTTTNFDGTFTLNNVPLSKSAAAGDQIPVVIQLGRWRRVYHFTISKSCAENDVADMNLPSTSAEGDIPLTAISTGSYDSIECVLLKMGVSQAEFMSYSTWAAEAASGTAPKKGRVHIYTGTDIPETASRGPGATLAPQQDETVLMGANGTLMKYDQILLPCWGDAFTKSAAELANLISYGNAGGRFFATHYSYSWLNTNGALAGTAQWDPRANPNNTNPPPSGQPFTGNVAVNVPSTSPGTFVKWLNLMGALNNGNPAGAPPANPTVTIAAGRHDVDKVLGKSVEWIDGTDPASTSNTSQMLLHFTFDMPVGQTSQCGHAIYSDFHVNGTTSSGMTFPNECDTAALTPQERILEYMIWDLASCVPGPPTSTCTPKTCKQQGIECGPAGDTCGNLIAGGCGSCATGQTCGGGGVSGICDMPPNGSCTPQTCASQGIACGPAADGCGKIIPACGMCTPGQSCGGGGIPGQCSPNRDCIPETCQDQHFNCGPAGDGCGNLIPSCGTCTPPDSCGGGGTPGVCGNSSGAR
jgi:hypothetical protein